jgi:hypothetical protein
LREIASGKLVEWNLGTDNCFFECPFCQVAPYGNLESGAELEFPLFFA